MHLELGLKLLLQLLLQLQLHLLMHPHLLDFIDELFRVYNFLVYHARSWVLLVHLLVVDCSRINSVAIRLPGLGNHLGGMEVLKLWLELVILGDVL